MAEQGLHHSVPGLSVACREPVDLHCLRLRNPDERALQAIGQAIGTALPVRPNSVTRGQPSALWLAPSEWLLVGSINDGRSIIEAAASVAAAHLSDLTHGRTVFEIRGDYGADLLSKGCTLDFHIEIFPLGSCAQTALAQAPVTIERLEDDLFHIYFDISLTEHMELWFRDAMLEFELGN